MADFKVSVTPSAGLERSLNAVHLLGVPVRDFERAWAERIKDDAVAHAPHDLDTLKKAHRVEMGPGSIPAWSAVRVDVPYAKAVHDGTVPHWMPRAAIQGWADRHGIDPFLVQRAIAKRGTKPQPWLRDAAERSRSSVGGLVGKLAGAIVARWGK